mmetsp:Transcript_37842/g.150762  ORF Transcript_37842/g.150762 Transcript_37842/m.150762 type:complete len:82 (+) Transcript_37842:91-336(+)
MLRKELALEKGFEGELNHGFLYFRPFAQKTELGRKPAQQTLASHASLRRRPFSNLLRDGMLCTRITSTKTILAGTTPESLI